MSACCGTRDSRTNMPLAVHGACLTCVHRGRPTVVLQSTSPKRPEQNRSPACAAPPAVDG